MEPESRFTEPRADCPHPERWHSPDSDSTEIEVSRLVAAFVEALRPDCVLETGTAFGQTAQLIGRSLINSGPGATLISFEIDGNRVQEARERCEGLPVVVSRESSLEGIDRLRDEGMSKQFGFAWLDSLFELRVPELRAIRTLLTPGAIVGIHDCGEPGHTKYNNFAREVALEADRLGFGRISLPTPRGVTFLQWKG
jgi:predicted O-methyltransferase YrrM